MRVGSLSNRGSSTSAGVRHRQRRRAPAPRQGPLPDHHATLKSEAPDSLTLAPSVGAEPVVSVKGNWGVGGSTAEAFVVTRTVWPDDDAVGDGGIDEIVVYDPVSGEQCATVSLPHSEFPRSIDGLPGCRALVTVPGPSTLLLGRS